ncbi:cell surface protein [Vibrio lentus]|uniref:VCBS domain-containing protein n=1 Tax=Vibrio lentus TaxID=136468 RepID=UPI000C84CB29|nr:VCBS domain-containing protein [Vibrio lentus]MCC4817477.1 VCBS domain-containing protein [Vibrio lentus]PMG72412.1 cell surface protein [Vibrio lentus]PMK91318.1 cell surface protein [Vibrio lentus]PML22352.1 cell surface protein [Vibrio lentus]PMM26593.1 cell surface protein [Vibrio lentus]
MGNFNLNILGLASGSVVLNAQGQVRRLSPGEQPAASDVVISFETSEASVPSVSARFVDNQGQQNVLDTDDAIAQVQRTIEEGFDPTELGDEFDTAAGEQGSSLTNSGRIERTGAETQAATNFETDGLESQGLSETQSIALFDIIAFALVSGEANVVEFESDEAIETGGTLTIEDPGVTFIAKGVEGDNGLGSFVVNEDGTWTFVANSPFDELADGEQIQDTTTVQTSDGGEQVITVTIIGTDDAALATDDTGSVTEDEDVDELTNQLVTSGQVTITDVDSDTPAFLPDGEFNLEGSTNESQLGVLTIDPDGAWTYVVNNDDVQYLDDDEFVTEIYTVTADDGTTSEVIVTINGADDPSDITVGEGDSDTGEVTEDVEVDQESNNLMTSGTLTITDVDANDVAAFESDGTFNPDGSTNDTALGMLSITDDGEWTYVVNNDLVQYLDDDEFVTEVYKVTAIDGTTSEVTITINGADDPSEITVEEGDSDMGEVTEDVDVDEESNTLETTGSLTISDADTSDNPAFNPSGAFKPFGSTNAIPLGKLTITSDGEWTYTVDNDAVQYLDDNETVTEIYMVSATDGTTSEVTIIINGAEDPSEITVGEGDSDTGSVTEDVDVDDESNTLETTGSLTISDPDTSDNPAFNPSGAFKPSGSTNAIPLGTLTITSDGEWTYTVDNDAVQYLDENETVTEIYTVSAADGTTSEVTITINGADDPSEITVGEGDSDTGEVTEDLNVDLETNELMTSGTLTITDVDTSDMPAFKPNGVFTPVGSTYALALGMLTITPEGAWSYVVDNDAVQYLGDDDTVIENYVVTAIDGVEHVIEITINGVNDAPEATSFVVVNDDDAVIPILFDSEDGGMPDYISDIEDDHNEIPLNVRIDTLPTSGTLLYTDENGNTREIVQSDVDSSVLFVPNNISFVAGPGELFEMGFSGNPEDMPDLVDGFYNWGVAVSPTERLITLANGNTITLTIEDNNDKPLKQYQGEQPHVGYGIGDTDGRGMNKQETLILDFTDNPLDVVDFGLDGLGGSFNTNSNVYVEVLYTFADGSTHTEQYQKDPGDTGNSQLLYEFSYSSPNNPIVGMELSSSGGSWELRYVQGSEAVTDDPQFDYVAVDSSGAESTVETVTIDTEEPQLYNVISAASNEPLFAAAGNDLLIGGSQDNIFTWLDSALDNGTDIIKDFELYTNGSGDLIDLNDLIEDPQDETQMAELLDMIEVSVDGEDIALSIPINGGGDVQTIVVEGIATEMGASVDLGSDLAILGELIKNDAA